MEDGVDTSSVTKVENIMLQSYCPEMNEPRPENTQIDAELSHYGGHWFLRTPLVLKGRGIVHLKTETADTLVPKAHHKIGWHKYQVTSKAFEAICVKYNVATEAML